MKILRILFIAALLAAALLIAGRAFGTDIYRFDAKTGEYLSRGIAKTDPLEGTALIPANATTSAVPSAPLTNAVYVFSGGQWAEAEDHRGEVWYWPTSQTPVTVKTLGPIPSGMQTNAPVEPYSAERVAEQISNIADQVLYSEYPQTQMLRYLARAVEITEKIALGTVTSNELAEAEAIRAVNTVSQAVRVRQQELTAAAQANEEPLSQDDLNYIEAELSAVLEGEQE